jgi:hypothetical protein
MHFLARGSDCVTVLRLHVHSRYVIGLWCIKALNGNTKLKQGTNESHNKSLTSKQQVLLDSASQEITLHLKARRIIGVLTLARCRFLCWRQEVQGEKHHSSVICLFAYSYIFFCLYFDLSPLLVAVFSPLVGHSPRGQACCTEQDSTCALTWRAVSSCSAPDLNSRGAESEWRLLRGLNSFLYALQANSDVLSPLGPTASCYILSSSLFFNIPIIWPHIA